MQSIRSFVSWVKNNPGKVAVVAIGSALFLGGLIVPFYNKLRAKVPALPAPKV